MQRFLFLLRLAVLLAAGAAGAAPSTAPPFQVSAGVADGGRVELRFEVAPGYFLYRDRFELSLAGSAADSARLGPIVIPPGTHREGGAGGSGAELLAGHVELLVGLVADRGPLRIDVSYQGCTDVGVCLAPRFGRVDLEFRNGRLATAIWRDGPAPDAGASRGSDRIDAALRSGSALVIMAAFFGAGVLLSLTPCMLPMVPILSSIIAGQAPAAPRRRGIALALSYTLGMALVYTALGVTAGLLGEGLAGLLQNRWTLGFFALLMVALALAMFGVFDLQLAGAVQARITSLSNRLPGGQMAAVFAMGGLSALMVGPCVAPPLAGALLFIGRTQDVALGGLALFCLAMGLGVPLLVVGASAGSLLPRAGPWMTRVKQALGVVLLAVAMWMLAPVLAPPDPGGSTPASGPEAPPDAAGFRPVRSAAEFDTLLKEARRPVVVFFSAAWCLTCAQLERVTLRHESVRPRLDTAERIRIDLTLNGDDERALLRRFGLFGPPAVLLFRPGGEEVAPARVIGFVAPDAFLASLAQAGL